MTTTSSSPAPELPVCLTRDKLTSAWFPSIGKPALHAIIALALIFALVSFNRLNHTDLWGHLNFGRWIVEHRELPSADPFAAQPNARPLWHGAWLAQVAAYVVQQTCGNEGLVLGHALLVTATAGALMLAVVRRGVPAGWAWVAGAALFVLNLPMGGTTGPQLFGQLGAALFLLACAELPARRHPLVWLPLVAACWANLHGSILIGLGILLAFAVGTSWNLWIEQGRREPGRGLSRAVADIRLARCWLACALAVAGSCLNPHGPFLLLETFTCGDIRMLAWLAVVGPWIAIPHAAAAWRAYCPAGHLAAPIADRPAAMNTVLAMGVVWMTALIAPPSYALVSGRPRGEGPIVVADAPIYVADEMARRGLEGKIAAPPDWADYLVWKTDGRLRPLDFSHGHLTDRKTWHDYATLARGERAWLEVLRAHQMRYVLVSRNRSPELVRRITAEQRSARPAVRIIYQDQRCLLAELSADFKPPPIPGRLVER
ncbi:MAG: hypothetical protein WD872_17965 [Pirellulaceae bacterium]